MKKIVPALFLSALISLSGCGGSVSQNASSAEKIDTQEEFVMKKDENKETEIIKNKEFLECKQKNFTLVFSYVIINTGGKN